MNQIIETPECPLCHKSSTLELTPEETQAWIEWKGGKPIQKAFPHWDVDKRELLKTGAHPECWERIFHPDRFAKEKKADLKE